MGKCSSAHGLPLLPSLAVMVGQISWSCVSEIDTCVVAQMVSWLVS